MTVTVTLIGSDIGVQEGDGILFHVIPLPNNQGDTPVAYRVGDHILDSGRRAQVRQRHYRVEIVNTGGEPLRDVRVQLMRMDWSYSVTRPEETHELMIGFIDAGKTQTFDFDLPYEIEHACMGNIQTLRTIISSRPDPRSFRRKILADTGSSNGLNAPIETPAIMPFKSFAR